MAMESTSGFYQSPQGFAEATAYLGKGGWVTKPIMADTEVADILDKAADLYQAEEVDWCANDWIRQNQTGKISVCAGGAIALASGVDQQKFYASYYDGSGNIVSDPSFYRFNVALNRLSEYLGEPVPSWNDNRLVPKSKQDTIDMLKHAAKDLRDGIERESSLG